MIRKVSTTALTLGELIRIAPMSGADHDGLADPGRRVEQVVLAEDFDRLRRASPHSLVVLHDQAASGGWSLAAALHLAWERNLSGVVVPQRIATASGVALARRLGVSLFSIDGDLVDVALQLAGQVSVPGAARAVRQAQCAERLADASGVRGVLAVLNSELGSVPVALLAGESVLAGRYAAVTRRPDQALVEVEISGPGDQPWARLVAAVPTSSSADVEQVTSLLRLARPALQAAWAQTRLNSSIDVAREQAAFALLRRSATDARPDRGDAVAAAEASPGDAPSWVTELGWRVNEVNRAVWLSPLSTSPEPSTELTHLVRGAWQRGRPDWPLIADGDGWISWHSSPDGEDAAAVRRVLSSFREVAAAHGLVVGVGRPHPGVPGLLRSVTEARLAAHLAREAGPGTSRWFDQVGAAAALAWLPTADITHVADLCLGDFMAARDRDVLVPTVLAVLDCGGSLSQASQRLGVHRNTVLARLARARQLGLPFDDPGQRLAMHVICYSLAAQSGGQAQTSGPAQTSMP